MFYLASGIIRHKDYNNNELLEWSVNSDCDTVHILSTFFKTHNDHAGCGLEFTDKLTIDGIDYFGKQQVNQIVSGDFTIYFASDATGTDEGFVLNWSCTEWGEWTQTFDGTCRDVKRPIINGLDTIGHLKYRFSNSTCSKFLNKESLD